LTNINEILPTIRFKKYIENVNIKLLNTLFSLKKNKSYIYKENPTPIG